MITAYLIANIFIFGLFGLMMLFSPDRLFNSIGVDISGDDGRYEIRSMYGGISVAVAVLCAMAIKNPMLQPAAFIFLLTYMAGYLFGRIAGLFLDGLPSGKFYGFIATELAIAGGALYFLCQGSGAG